MLNREKHSALNSLHNYITAVEKSQGLFSEKGHKKEHI